MSRCRRRHRLRLHDREHARPNRPAQLGAGALVPPTRPLHVGRHARARFRRRHRRKGERGGRPRLQRPRALPINKHAPHEERPRVGRHRRPLVHRVPPSGDRLGQRRLRHDARARLKHHVNGDRLRRDRLPRAVSKASYPSRAPDALEIGALCATLDRTASYCGWTVISGIGASCATLDRTASYCGWTVISGHVGPYETRLCIVAHILVRIGTVGTARSAVPSAPLRSASGARPSSEGRGAPRRGGPRSGPFNTRDNLCLHVH